MLPEISLAFFENHGINFVFVISICTNALSDKLPDKDFVLPNPMNPPFLVKSPLAFSSFVVPHA